MDRENYKNLINRALGYNYCRKEDYEKGLPLLKTSISNEEDIKNFIDFSLKYATKFTQEKNWLRILEIYKELLEFKEIPNKLYKNIGLCLSAIGSNKEAIDFFKYYENLEPEDKETYSFVGEIALDYLNDYLLAIEYYEKALKVGSESFLIYNALGHCYSKYYRDSHKEEQIKYFEKALELEPNNEVVVKNLAYVYGKFGETKKADEMYGRMMMLSPSHSDLHSYGAYLVKNKKFKAGFKFLRHRFYKEDISGSAFASILKYRDKLWKIGEPLEGKRVLVHYEQGLGDSIMFARFLKDLKDKCKSVEVILQEGLIDLFKDSGIPFPIRKREEVKNIGFDCLVPMMDLPLVYNLKADNIPYSEGYLNVSEDKVAEYNKKYIKKTKKLKIGFAFEGSETSLGTKRDIPIECFYKLMRMKNVDMYCFQVGDIFKQLDKVPKTCKFTKLGDTFKNWKDTACALKNMDLLITSDNGVMNLAGALGVKTFGVFNSMAEWRWFKLEGDDVAWYKSVKPFKCTSTDDWESAMKKVIKEVKELIDPLEE